MSVKPTTRIEPILNELGRIIPCSYYISNEFKKQCIKENIDDYWAQLIELAKKERHIYVAGMGLDNKRIDAGNALILWANSLFAQNGVEALFELVFFLLNSYTSYSKKKIDVRELKECFMLIGLSDEDGQRLDQFGLNTFDIKLSATSSLIRDNKRIEELKEQIEKAVSEDNYNLIITLVYTLIEGVLKGYLEERNEAYNQKDDIVTLAKKVKLLIQEENNFKYSQKKALHQISTIVDVVNELRNNNSVSHCSENSDFVTSIFVRDLGFSLANLLINSLEYVKNPKAIGS